MKKRTPECGWTGIWPRRCLCFPPLWRKNTFVSSESNATALGRNGTTGWKRGFAPAIYQRRVFDRPRADNAYLTVTSPKLHLIYEDAHLLLVDKQPGLAVHPHDGAEYGKTLIDHIQAYLYAKGDWRPRQSTFVPALCNRIDRNTGGIVIAAKSAEALRILNQKVRDRELDKRYLAVIEGRMHPPEGTLRGQIFKDAAQNRVYVTDKPQPGSKTALTHYRTPRSEMVCRWWNVSW